MSFATREQVIDQAVRIAMMDSRNYLDGGKGRPFLKRLLETRHRDARPMWWFSTSVRAWWRVLCANRARPPTASASPTGEPSSGDDDL